MAELYNEKINPIDRLIQLKKIMDNQKRTIIECEIKVATYKKQLNLVKLKPGAGSEQDLVFLQQQINQQSAAFEGTSAALEITKEIIFDLHDKHWQEDSFSEKMIELYGTSQKDILA